jgi:hypothetical protein
MLRSRTKRGDQQVKGYEVEVLETRKTRYFVMSHTPSEACNDVEDLYDSDDAHPWDVEVDIHVVSTPAQIPAGERVWTGGPEGQWATA